MNYSIMIYDLEKIYKVEKNKDKINKVYFGREFCSRRIVTKGEIKKVWDFCSNFKIKLAIVTPIIMESCLDKVEEVLKYILSLNIKCEIVINDWGLLYLINKKYKGKFDVVLGRLLNKVKKSPYIYNIIPKIDNNSFNALKVSSANFVETEKLLEAYDVKAIQYENIYQGNIVKNNKKIKKYLVYPYVYITSSRTCISSRLYYDKNLTNMDICKNICIEKPIELYELDVKSKTYLIGNSMYYKNEVLPKELDYDELIYTIY